MKSKTIFSQLTFFCIFRLRFFNDLESFCFSTIVFRSHRVTYSTLLFRLRLSYIIRITNIFYLFWHHVTWQHLTLPIPVTARRHRIWSDTLRIDNQRFAEHATRFLRLFLLKWFSIHYQTRVIQIADLNIKGSKRRHCCLSGQHHFWSRDVSLFRVHFRRGF